MVLIGGENYYRGDIMNAKELANKLLEVANLPVYVENQEILNWFHSVTDIKVIDERVIIELDDGDY